MEWYFKYLFMVVCGMFCRILWEVGSIKCCGDSWYFWVIWGDIGLDR